MGIDDERKTDQNLNIIKIFTHNNTNKTNVNETPHDIMHASCLRYKALVCEKYLYKKAGLLENNLFYNFCFSILTHNFF